MYFNKWAGESVYVSIGYLWLRIFFFRAEHEGMCAFTEWWWTNSYELNGVHLICPTFFKQDETKIDTHFSSLLGGGDSAIGRRSLNKEDPVLCALCSVLCALCSDYLLWWAWHRSFVKSQIACPLFHHERWHIEATLHKGYVGLTIYAETFPMSLLSHRTVL